MRKEQERNHEVCFSDISGSKLAKDKIDEDRNQWVTFAQRFML
ncbi:hypothetical protein V2J09_005638 [Rumex salicifolius]